ncbi:heterokaryon incompatibility protein-domain-containing protein [Xylaria venustula]|nr:heterokaryon incompatibility protein-domain-containing protein [Xylaria venustula]
MHLEWMSLNYLTIKWCERKLQVSPQPLFLCSKKDFCQLVKAMAPYEYSTLCDDHSIRILTLFAGSGDDPLCGRLTDLNVESLDTEYYEPLSYVWGDPTRTHSFTCDGKTLGLTQSLHHALRQLRKADGSRRIWVDQICINQNDFAERGKQVQFMNVIYKCADHVLVWLGRDEEGVADVAFGHVRALAETFADPTKYEQFVADHTGENIKLRSHKDWAPIQHLTSLPWFERAWIVQEIGTTAPATLLWGSCSMNWDTLYRVCDRLTGFHHLRRHFNIDTAKVKFVFQRFVPPDFATRHSNRLSFVYELHRARHLRATDARDRVFAFLGHYSVAEGKNKNLRCLQANYDPAIWPVSRVYSHAAACALRGGGAEEGLIVLGSVQHLSLPSTYREWDELRQTSDYLPTWVPDWRTYTSHILSEPASPHRASGRFSNQDLEIEAGETILKIKGVCIDTIAKASNPLAPKAFHQRGGGKEPQVDTLWKEVCDHDGVSSALFSLDYSYPGNNGVRGPAVLAYMQTLSNGGAATALRRRDTHGRHNNHGAKADWYHGISDQEWLSQAAAYLVRAGDREHEEGRTVMRMQRELKTIGDRAIAEAAAVSTDGNNKSNGSRGHESPDEEWSRSANGATSNRVFARTEKGYYVLGPKVLAKDDIVCVLWGGRMAFCLRPLEMNSRKVYLLVGECYIHGFMRGEVGDMVDDGTLEVEDFELV